MLTVLNLEKDSVFSSLIMAYNEAFIDQLVRSILRCVMARVQY